MAFSGTNCKRDITANDIVSSNANNPVDSGIEHPTNKMIWVLPHIRSLTSDGFRDDMSGDALHSACESVRLARDQQQAEILDAISEVWKLIRNP